MRNSLLAGAALATLSALPAQAADPTALDKALKAARLAAATAQRADEAAQAARTAAQEAKDAADAARAAAKAAGLTDVTKADINAPTGDGQQLAKADGAGDNPGAKQGAGEGKPKVGGAASGRDEGASIYLTANTEGGNATIKYDWYPAGKDGAPGGRYVNHTLTLSSPLSSGAKSVEIATLDGLVSGASVGYTFTAGDFASNFLPNANSASYLLAGVQARVGYKKYKFLNTGTLKDETSEKYSQSLAPYIAYSSPSSVLYIAKFDYQRGYKEADAKMMCPQAQTFPVTCANGAAGAPKEQIKRIFTLTTRFFVASSASAEVNLSYDRTSRVKGIDVPVYFLQSKDIKDSFTPYNAGLRFGWRSDTKDPSIGIFVGSPFKFWGL